MPFQPRRALTMILAVGFLGALALFLIEAAGSACGLAGRVALASSLVVSQPEAERSRRTLEGVSPLYAGSPVGIAGLLATVAPLDDAVRRAPPFGLKVVLVSGAGDVQTLWGSMMLQYRWSPSAWVTPIPWRMMRPDPDDPQHAIRRECLGYLDGAEIFVFHEIEAGGIDLVAQSLRRAFGEDAIEFVRGGGDRHRIGLLNTLTSRIRRGDPDVGYLRGLLP